MDFDPLYKLLLRRDDAELVLPFDQIEQALGQPLPPGARAQERWWLGSSVHHPHHPQKEAWSRAGFLVASVDLDAEAVTLTRGTVDARFRLDA